MSLESHLRESMLKTALFHLLKNQRKSPDRAARNIQEMLLRFNPSGEAGAFQYDTLLQVINSCSEEDCISWIMNHLS